MTAAEPGPGPKPAKRALHQATPEAIREALADASPTPTHATVRTLHDIAAAILGFDPRRADHTDSGAGGRYGQCSRTDDQLINQHISITALGRLLDAMIEDGIVSKVAGPSYAERGAQARRLSRALYFPGRTRSGYVLTELLDAQLARVDSEARDARRTKLREQARFNLAERFQAEYDAIYLELAQAEGLAPEREQPIQDRMFGRFLSPRRTDSGRPIGVLVTDGDPTILRATDDGLDTDGFHDPEAAR